MNERDSKPELIVVFKNVISLEKAMEILDGTGIKYREGMDSSRGKIYFYRTGPKFIVTFGLDREIEAFMSYCEGLEEIYEIYTPNWDIQKD